MKQSTRFATLAAAAFLIISRPVAASLNLTGVIFPLIEIEAVAALILAALAVIWVISKMIGLTDDQINYAERWRNKAGSDGSDFCERENRGFGLCFGNDWLSGYRKNGRRNF